MEKGEKKKTDYIVRVRFTVRYIQIYSYNSTLEVGLNSTQVLAVGFFAH